MTAWHCQTGGVAGDEELFDYLEDLEAQAVALHDADRRAEVADRARAEYRDVPLAARLMASCGAQLALQVEGVGVVTGRLARVGTGWCAVQAAGTDWVVSTPALVAVRGASDRAVPEVAWRRTDRLGLGSVLRQHAEAGLVCHAHLRDGTRHEGRVARVGSDFLELQGQGRTSLVSLGHLAALSAPAGPWTR